MHTLQATHRSATIAACVVLVALALVGGRAAMAAFPATTPEEFSVGGEIDGLYPGVVGVLDAHVLNPWDVAIEVTSIVVVASDAGSDCPGTMLQFAPTAGSVVIAARSQAVVGVPVTLDAAATDACRGATWPLEFTARATGPDGVDRTGSGPLGQPPRGDRTLAHTGAAIATAVAFGVALVFVGLLLTRARRNRLAEPTAQPGRNVR